MTPTIIAAIIGVGGLVAKAATDTVLTITGRKSQRLAEAAERAAIEAANNRKKFILKVIGCILIGIFVIWSFYTVFTQFIKKPVYVSETTVNYSVDTNENWAYGNLQKEFSADEVCYARISSNITASNLKGNNNDIQIRYIFSGTADVDVELSEGLIMERFYDLDNDQIIFTSTQKSKCINKFSKESLNEKITIFKLSPKSEGSLSITIQYDDNLDEEYTVFNSIYFVEE